MLRRSRCRNSTRPVCNRGCGGCVFGHPRVLSLMLAQPNSSLAFTFAMTTAPAPRNFLVTAAPYRVGLCLRREPTSSPSTFMLSWSTTGTPCNRLRGAVCSPPLSKLRTVGKLRLITALTRAPTCRGPQSGWHTVGATFLRKASPHRERD